MILLEMGQLKPTNNGACARDTVIGDRIRVPAGVNVVAPVHAVMWSEANYDRPTEFLPERYTSY